MIINRLPTDSDRETPLLEVSGSVVGKISFGKLAWAVMEWMKQEVIRINTYLGDRGARVHVRAHHRRGRDYEPLRHDHVRESD